MALFRMRDIAVIAVLHCCIDSVDVSFIAL